MDKEKKKHKIVDLVYAILFSSVAIVLIVFTIIKKNYPSIPWIIALTILSIVFWYSFKKNKSTPA